MVANPPAGTALRPRRFSTRLVLPLALCALAPAALPAVAQSSNEWQSAAWQLWQINVDGSGLKQLADLRGRRCVSPVWSPDGKAIAFDTMRFAEGWTDSQVAVVRNDGTNFHVIGLGGVPSWSPDGRLICCESHNTPFGITVANPDGSGRELILDHGSSPRWSPRGTHIFVIQQKLDGIFRFDVASGLETSVISGHYAIHHGFSISPDGRRICFSSYINPGLALATLDEQSAHAKIRWLLDTGIAYHSSWSPDGSHIVFAWRPNEDVPTQLYTLDVDSDDPPQLLPGQERQSNNVNPAWSPDGEKIVFSRPASF